jgi:hypothetical protein
VRESVMKIPGGRPTYCWSAGGAGSGAPGFDPVRAVVARDGVRVLIAAVHVAVRADQDRVRVLHRGIGLAALDEDLHERPRPIGAFRSVLDDARVLLPRIHHEQAAVAQHAHAAQVLQRRPDRPEASCSTFEPALPRT